MPGHKPRMYALCQTSLWLMPKACLLAHCDIGCRLRLGSPAHPLHNRAGLGGLVAAGLVAWLGGGGRSSLGSVSGCPPGASPVVVLVS